MVVQEGSKQTAAGEWRKTTLGAVADFISGGTPSKSRSDYWGGSMPWVSAKDMKRLQLHETEDKVTTAGVANGTREVPANTVLILVRGMTLLNDVPVCITERPMTFNQDVKALRPKSTVAEDFLPYLVLGNKDRLLGLVDLAGHGTGRLNTDEVKALEIDLPPLPEQRAIAHVLGTLDDKIELNRRMNETLQEMARALFKSWFVDFDPVRAKATLKQHAAQASESIEGDVDPSAQGRHASPADEWTVERARAYLDTMDRQIVDLFPDRLVDSELGEIPEGWAVGVLDDSIELISGGTPRTSVSSYWNGDIPWYTPKDAPSLSDVFVLETERTITQEGIQDSAARIVPVGTTIVTARGTVGRLACLGVPMAMNQTCYGIRGAHEYPDFFTYWNVRTAVNALQQRSHGTVFDTVTRQTFKVVETVLPPINHARAFESTLKPLMGRILTNLSESRSLAAQRDVLLPRLVSGEVGVGEVHSK